jgi:uncharacterized protein (TIRG00374 family)
MKIKIILLIALLIALPVFTGYLLANQDALEILKDQLQKQNVLVAFASSTLLLLCAHIVRAFKTKFLTDSIKNTQLTTHIRALFIGYLFNALLPIRAGEFIRAVVLGKGTRMSSAFMFGLVVLDRAVDSVVLGLLTLYLLLTTGVFDSPKLHGVILMAAIILITFGLILLGLLYVLRRQPARLLLWWHRFTKLFNDDLRDSLRFKMWTLMYGLERVFIPGRLARYAALSLLMWFIYIAALAPLVVTFLPASSSEQVTTNSAISYLGISAPAGPAHIGSYQTFVQPYIDVQPVHNPVRNLLALAWLLQVFPAFAVGLFFVLKTSETLQKPMANKDLQAIDDKLLRDVDITKDLGSFLDAFFTNNSLSRIMHRFEVDKRSKLIHYFKGGSNAVTALVHENNTFLVRKITPLQYKYKLKSQYDWLKSKKNLKNIVNVLSEETTEDYYKIDLEYNKEYLPFFEYIHSMPRAKSQKILRDIFAYLFKNIYKLDKPGYHPEDLEAYIEARCLSKIRQAAEVNDEIRSLLAYKHLIINGQKYDNIPVIISKIKKDKNLTKILATYRKCSVHGDTTIDNILTLKKNGDFLLIDPTDNENEISGPVFDFGRTAQSLRYGYEFLCQDERKIEVLDNRIDFEYSLSSNYAELYNELLNLQKKYLTKEEQSAVLFHTSVLYSRMLTHRVVINPLNAAKFYAVSVMAFNDFIDGVKK